jgi:hypothetical protein
MATREPLIQLNVQTTFLRDTPKDKWPSLDPPLVLRETYVLGNLWFKLEAPLQAVRRLLSQPPQWVVSVEIPDKLVHPQVHQECLFVQLFVKPPCRFCASMPDRDSSPIVCPVCTPKASPPPPVLSAPCVICKEPAPPVQLGSKLPPTCLKCLAKYRK